MDTNLTQTAEPTISSGASIPRHMPALDGLRGMAILLVLLIHCGQGWSGTIHGDGGVGPQGFAIPLWLQRITDGGGSGVQLFFVISAFTLTVQANRGGRGGLGGYAIRRIARVGPGFWVAALGYALLAGLGPRAWAPAGIDVGAFLRGTVFLSAWDGGASLAVVPGGWSVSCEMTFYLALPLLLLFVDGRIWRAAALTLILLGVAQIRARHEIASGHWGFLPYVHPVQQAAVFMLGVTAALIVLHRPLPRIPGAALALLGLAIFAVPFSPVPEWHLLHYLLFAGLVTVAVALAATAPPFLLASAAMRRIGEVSFSMYLIHFAVLATSLRVSQRLLPGTDAATLGVHYGLTVFASFLIAHVTYRYVEQPGIALGAYLARQSRGDAARLLLNQTAQRE